uniref:Uncharacterized protein n=1 Tax=viral metagenome TaxID=1070528 RepID=A0A6M3M9F4_9ZZZZ
MASLITKVDLESELQITFEAGFDALITKICTWADNTLKLKTNRTAFSGVVTEIAFFAEICIAINRLAISHPDLMKAAISSVSENGAQISFNNGKSLDSYRQEANSIIADLYLEGDQDFSLIFSDPANEHTGTEPGLY